MSPTYEFSFERSQLIKVFGGILSIVVLVFCAGILTGIALGFRQPAPALIAQAAHPQPAGTPAPVPVVILPPVESPVPDETSGSASVKQDDAGVDADRPAVEEKVPAVKTADEAVQSGTPGNFAVQLGAFQRLENAESLSKKLLARGYDADVVIREDSHGRMWYLVRYGIFANRSEAAAAALDIKSRENLDALVRPSNSI